MVGGVHGVYTPPPPKPGSGPRGEGGGGAAPGGGHGPRCPGPVKDCPGSREKRPCPLSPPVPWGQSRPGVEVVRGWGKGMQPENGGVTSGGCLGEQMGGVSAPVRTSSPAPVPVG